MPFGNFIIKKILKKHNQKGTYPYKKSTLWKRNEDQL